MLRTGSGLGALIALGMVIWSGFDPSLALARESGIQGTPDGKRILVNKDVEASRYAIAQDQDDRSATGNVFFTDDRSPAFLLCSALGGSDFACSVADPCPSSGRASGIQRRPDGKGILVSKDVGGERYAITANFDDGSLTGNVFFTDGRPPVFLFCQTLGGNSYSCSGTNRCTDSTCAPYAFLANITLPADFFSVPDGCPSFQPVGNVTLPSDFFSVPSATRGPLAVGSRQVVGGNPFGALTKGAGAASVALARRSSSVHAASTSIDETFDCIGGGTRTFTCRVNVADDGSNVTVSSVEGHQCTFPQNGGGVTIENGVFYTAVPDFGDCDPLPFLAGHEQLEELSPLIFDYVDAQGSLTQRQTENSTRLVTYGAECTNGAGTVSSAEQSRGLTGTVETVLFDGDGETHFLDVFDHVAQSIEYSKEPGCAPTYTLTAGSVTSTDDSTGEVYTTTYGREGGLQYTLDGSELLIGGGLTSECSGVESSFTFRTIQAPLFDESDPAGCPRDGRIEVSSNGTVIGQVVFTVEGGLQLIEVDGRTTGFASCNDGGLLLRCE